MRSQTCSVYGDFRILIDPFKFQQDPFLCAFFRQDQRLLIVSDTAGQKSAFRLIFRAVVL